jgi:glycolate oxidase FAD binding subunit
VRLSRLSAVLGLLQRSDVAVRGSLGAGVLYAGLPREAESGAAELLTALRAELPPGDGSAVVLRTEAVDRLDLWGPVGGLALMRRVKERFDPHRLLAPGRFVGGI